MSHKDEIQGTLPEVTGASGSLRLLHLTGPHDVTMLL